MKKALFVFMISLLLIGCLLTSRVTDLINAVKPSEAEMIEGTSTLTVSQGTERDFMAFLAENNIQIVSIKGTEGGAGTVGGLIDLELQNNDQFAHTIILPCGLVFVPENADLQKMMVIQPVSIDLNPGETVTITPFVACIQSSQDAPSAGDVYSSVEQSEGKLAVLADCFCQNDLNQENIQGQMSVQFATWMTADNSNYLDKLGSEQTGALGQVLGGQVGELAGSFVSMIAPDAQKWLDRCNIKVGE
ncbi:MAG: hypothetical protein FD147_629 [Chloroflexi bacterium]|nr:MAG: hypothetical protein FD147_629 [Chloroflexota bacterium]MBA4375567.1 hypothetical protein [Anaerolinea sp.]